MTEFGSTGGGGGPIQGSASKLRLGIYNRLEPRPRSEDFSKTLGAPVADALWMLTRQWQFGEFTAEDTGSAIFAKVQMQSNPLVRFGYQDNGDPDVYHVEAYNDNIPLEARIEAEIISFDMKTQMQINTYLKKLLVENEIPASLFDIFMLVYKFEIPGENDGGSYTADQQLGRFAGNLQERDEANFRSDAATFNRLSALIGRIMNAETFLNDLTPTTNLADLLINNDYQVTLSASQQTTLTTHQAALENVRDQLLEWISELFFQPTPETGNAWNRQRLEYQYQMAIGHADGSRSAVFSEEYYHGRPEWYVHCLDQQSAATQAIIATPIANESSYEIKTKTITLLPSDTDFPGMPSSRWWEFEDGKLNFGRINTNTSDLSTVIFAEFGLLFSKDWLLIPFKVPVGSMCEVKSIIFTDSFGFKTKVLPANRETDWSMFELTSLTNGQATIDEGRIFIPPLSYKTQEGEPIEKVLFIRDEMANMVWGIEKIIPDFLGNGISGFEAWMKKRKYLLAMADELVLEENAEGENAKYVYQLMTEVPENWIPFIPVHLPGKEDEIRLQRGKMNRNIEGLPFDVDTQVYPRGVLLSEEQPSYLIFEEEVPREGIQVSRSFQRARWWNGKTVCWLGRKKQIGKGEGSSNLVFDAIKGRE